MFYGHAMFMGGNSQIESRYLPSPVYRCRFWLIQNWLQFEQHYSDSVSSISSVKNSPANAIKISAAILNLVRFSLFDRCDSDKPEKITILLLSGCCLWTLHDHKALGDKNWDEFAKPFFKTKNIRGVWVLVTTAWISLHSAMNHENHETRSPSFTSSCARSTFCFCLQRAGVLFAACSSFVCSVLEFCLQRAGVLFAACRSLVCSVRKFCLQRVVLLFAACWSFVCSVREFCLQRVILLFAACWSFVCSVREFCLQRIILLFAACWSFVCSV